MVRFWIPATPILWLAAPAAFALAALVYLVPRRLRPADPFAAALAIGHVLIALSGAVVDIDTPDALVRLRIS